MARPRKITKEIVAKLEQAYKVGANDFEACEYAGIERTTLYRYEKENPEFCNIKRQWKSRPTLKAKFTVYKSLDDPKIAMDYLKSRDDDFSTKVKQEVTGDISITPKIEILPVKVVKPNEN